MPRTALHLRGRILALLVIGVVLFGSVNAWVFRSVMLRSLRSSLQVQGQALAELVADQSEPLLLHRDALGLDRLLAAFRARYAETFYIVVYDGNGAPVASTFPAGAPGFLASPRPRGSGSLYQAEGTYFQDFQAPILDGTLGTVRLGLAENAIRDRAAFGESAIQAMVVLFFLAGVGGSFLIAQDVHRDALRLSAAVQAFRMEGPVPVLPVNRRDEIGLVARAVQDMMGRLKGLQQENLALVARFRDADRMSSVGLIASGLAHDINNPLSGLLASLERLSRKPDDAARVAAYLPPMMEAARHIQEVLQRLLQFVRNPNYEETEVFLGDAAQRAQMLVAHSLPSGVALLIEIPAGLPPVRFDPAGLLQILVNILINAADAMEGRQGEITVRAGIEGGRVTLAVADEGTGMPPEALARAFDPLFTTKPPGRGTGLGLAIARQMMRDHGGDIELSSVPGEGTSVSLRFRSREV